MNICMVGAGYVGLVAGACLANFGMNVTCVDTDQGKIDMLNDGRLPLFEVGLADLVQRNAKEGRLHFTTDLEQAVDRSKVVFLAVGTPEGSGGRPDLSQIQAVGRQIGACLKEYKVIAIKSTVPVGTARELHKIISDNLTAPTAFDVVSNPEFLREGTAVNDFLQPDRIVLGSGSSRALDIMREVYRPLTLLKKPIVATTNETAELIKYAANTMLALRISYINEIANLCDLVGANVDDIAVALGLDKRIGPQCLQPGPGFGGSCIPKDTAGLANIAGTYGYDFKTVQAVMAVNTRQREIVVDKARQMLGSFDGQVTTLLGLSFKPNTDDIREAPAIHIARTLLDEGATVNVYDPAAMEAAKRAVPALVCHPDPYAACQGSDLVMIVTEWNEFRELDLKRVKKIVNQPNLFDTRNIYDGQKLRSLGFNYLSTGRAEPPKTNA